MIQSTNKDILKIKYRFRPVITFFSFALALFFGLGLYSIRDNQEIFMQGIMFVLTLLFLFGGSIQFILFKKEYHVLIDRKKMKMVVDMGFRKKKMIDLTLISGFSNQVQRNNHNTFYILQFLTTPEQWGSFYRKNDAKIERYHSQYESMYIVISLANQNEQDMKEICRFLIDSNLRTIDFQPSVLGSYPGVLKKGKIIDENYTKLEKNQKRRQLLSYFLMRLLFLLIIFYFIIFFIGIFHGIHW